MACDVSTNTFKLEAVNLSWGGEAKACITPVNGQTGGEYFTFATPDFKYYVWLNVDSSSTDPAPAGYTAIEVGVSSGYSVADYIAAAKAAIEATGEALVYVNADGVSFRIENLVIGEALEAVNAQTSTFTVEQEEIGFGGFLGKTKSGIELTLDVTEKTVTANQTGETALDNFATGMTITVSADLMEMTEDRMKLLVGRGYGDEMTVGSDTIIGFGTEKLYKSSLGFAGKLIGHPVRLPESDRSADFTINKTVPKFSSINFDGNEEQVLNVEFKSLVDPTKNNKLSIGTISGDWKKDLR